MLSNEDLIASYELGTYLDGLKDALNMTKPELKKAIRIIIDAS